VTWTTVNSAVNGFAYDSAGNVTNDNVNRYLYDAEGRICAVSRGEVNDIGIMTGYIYDAEGRRVAKGSISIWSCDPFTNGFTASGSERDYVLDQDGRQVTEVAEDSNGNMEWEHTNVWANGQLLGTYDANGLHFYLNDWLGTRRVETDYAGVLQQSCASLPYGNAETCIPVPTENLFTGKERDQESGNDYFGARYYASTMGRFLSPDYVDDGLDPVPVPWANPENPQTLNLYSYVQNNPLTLTDSDGHDVQICDANGQCNTISNDAYAAAQQSNNGGLNVPTLDQVGNNQTNGTFNATTITDANGNTVGTATYVVGDSPGLDPYVGNNMAGLHTLGVTGATMSDPRTYVLWEGASAAGALCGLYCVDAGATAIETYTTGQEALSAKVIAYLESRGVPATAAALAARKMLMNGGFNRGKTVIKFYAHELNQIVQQYRQSQASGQQP